MRAWHITNIVEEWSEYIFAETRGQAIVKAMEFPMNSQFTDYRARRCKWLDGEPREPTGRERIEHGHWARCELCHGDLWPPDPEDDKILAFSHIAYDLDNNAYHVACWGKKIQDRIL